MKKSISTLQSIVHRLNQRSISPWTRWQRRGQWRGFGVLLALLMLFAQQGALLHEMSHYAQSDDDSAAQYEEHEEHHHPGDLCETCLAFSHMAAVAVSKLFVPVLLSGLAFAHGAVPENAALVVETLFLRNRGPPAIF